VAFPAESVEAAPALSLGEKVRLSTEIMRVYARARWEMGRRELPSIVARIRENDRDLEFPDRAVRRQLGAVVMKVLSVLPTDSRCLVRSLVLLNLLQRRGAEGTLVVGVKTEPRFSAHAWIEYEGEPLIPSGGDKYARITVL
jgi:hypothetical protein